MLQSEGVDLAADIEEADRAERDRATIERLSGQLVKAKHRKADLVDAVYRAAGDAARGLVLKPVKPPAKDKRTAHEEVAQVDLSDWQLAKLTPDYSSDVCEQRIEVLADKVESIVKVQRADHPVKRLNVRALGDIIEGELIFPGQGHLIDSSLYRQVCIDGPRIMVGFLQRMQQLFESITFTGVIGNHGRVGGKASRDYDPETNADRMLYRNVANIMDANLPGGSGIEWVIPDGAHDRNWYAISEVGNYRSLLMHGDQFKGTAGMPWYSMQKKAGGWALGAMPEWVNDELQRIDEIAFGHWHQSTLVTLNGTTGRCNGSTESFNTYAQEQLGAMGSPQQWLTFVDPREGRITAEYRLHLGDKLAV